MVRQVRHPEEGQQFQCPLMSGLFPAPVPGQAQNAGDGGVALLIVETDLHIVLHGEVVEQADVLEGPGNAHAVDLSCGLAGGIQSIQQDGAPGGLIDLGQQVEDGGFAGAVGADEAGDLRPADGEVEVIHRPQAAEVDAQVAALQNGGFVDVPFRNDGMAGNRDHLALFKFLTHRGLPPFFWE